MIAAGEAAADPRAGGKGAALGRLVAAGFDVPAFLVVPAGTTPDAAALAEALPMLGAGPYAVRSSGLQEDGAADSHAGQFATRLDVPAVDVAAAVAQVMASGENAGLAAYRAGRGLAAQGSEVAVIVQQMVAAEAAGVAFSADPVSGRRDRVVVSATQGLGDRLVAGEIDGTSWRLDNSDRIVERRGAPILANAEVAAVAALAREVETAFGAPQDIEWALAGDRLHLLQARPVTSPLRPAPIADPERAVFDNSNIVESYPGLVGPLTFSFAAYAYARVYVAFVSLLGVPADLVARRRVVFDNMLVRVDGRVFYNLGNWYRALSLLPGYALNKSFMEGMMGVGAALPEAVAARIAADGSAETSKLREVARLVRASLGLLREARRLPRTIHAFEARLERALAATAPARLRTLALSELAAEYRRIEADLLDRWDAPIVNDFLCMIAFGATRRLLERWLGAQGIALQNDVLIGQGDIVSARPPQLIRAMGASAREEPAMLAALEAGDARALAAGPLAAPIAAYIAEFGDRCTEELKLESVTLDEDPRPLHAAILASARVGAGTPAPPRDATAALARAFAGRPLRRRVATHLLAWTKARVRDRENLRFARTRIFGRARRLMLAIGAQFHALGLLDKPRDVFLLTIQEVLGAIEGFGACADLAGIAAVRRGEMARAALLPEPPERILVEGAAITASGNTAATSEAAGAAELERHGTGCSAGRVTAVARVIADPRTQSLAAGEILVARHTDPGWIALFAGAAAIVVERGSLLSHSAIVARELGIPCVVGLAGACGWIQDGEALEVDGASGLVRRHPA